MLMIISEIITALCLCIGFYFGYKIGKSDNTLNDEGMKKPLKAFNKIKSSKISREEKRRYEEEMSKLETIWRNVNEYDGSTKNQKSIN